MHSHCSCQSTDCWIRALPTPPPLLPLRAQIWPNASIWAGHPPAITTTHLCTWKFQEQEVSSNTNLAPHVRIRTSGPFLSKELQYMLSFTPFSDRHVTLVSSPKNNQPGAPVGLPAWYSCGMGPGPVVSQGLKEWDCLFSWRFGLHVIQIMSRTEQQVLTQPEGVTVKEIQHAQILLMRSQRG